MSYSRRYDIHCVEGVVLHPRLGDPIRVATTTVETGFVVYFKLLERDGNMRPIGRTVVSYDTVKNELHVFEEEFEKAKKALEKPINSDGS